MEQTLLTNCLLFDFQEDKHVRMIALGVGKYSEFMDQLHEIAGDNVYTADNFDELSDLFDEILLESCSKYNLIEIARKSHISLRIEQIHYIIITIMRDPDLGLAYKSHKRSGNESCKEIREVL